MTEQPWLLVVDPQVIFADPTSDWASPMWPKAAGNILRLMAEFDDRTIITRWLPDPDPSGSWVDYLTAWPFANVVPTDPKLALLPEFAAAPGHRLDATTFGKWGEPLQEITGPHPQLVITGVSTDCCVLSTVLPAVDAGAYVQLVTDACAGSSENNHRTALSLLALYPPQVTLTTSDALLHRR